MSLSSELHQCGVLPGMMIMSPADTRRDTPPLILSPRGPGFRPGGGAFTSVITPPVTSAPRASVLSFAIAAPCPHAISDLFAGGRSLAETHGMQQLVNEENLAVVRPLVEVGSK